MSVETQPDCSSSSSSVSLLEALWRVTLASSSATLTDTEGRTAHRWASLAEKLREYFEQYGEVIETPIMKEKMTQRPRGFGFVIFADPNVAESVAAEKHSIDGRSVRRRPVRCVPCVVRCEAILPCQIRQLCFVAPA